MKDIYAWKQLLSPTAGRLSFIFSASKRIPAVSTFSFSSQFLFLFLLFKKLRTEKGQRPQDLLLSFILSNDFILLQVENH